MNNESENESTTSLSLSEVMQGEVKGYWCVISARKFICSISFTLHST